MVYRNKNILLFVLTLVVFNVFANETADQEKSLSRQKRLLVFPASTVWQLSMAMVSQVSKITSHKFAINAGFQINYNLPYNLSNFYKTTYFARSSSPVTLFFNKLVESADDFALGLSGKLAPTELPISSDSDDDGMLKSGTTENLEVLDDNEETTTEAQTTTKKSKKKRKSKTKRDITAAEFYAGIKDTMSFAGYHDDCLLKSICELAKHPLGDHNNNLMYEVLHFILTPSVHQAFDPDDEEEERKLYEKAEAIGISGGDCELSYGNCENSPLHTISNYITEEIYE